MRDDISSDVIEEQIYDLEGLGLIDDDAYASMWIRSCVEHRPYGEFAVRQQLKKRGVDDEVIERQMNLQYPGELEVGRVLAEKRRKRIKTSEFMVFRQKLGNALQRRGFAYDVIETLVDEMWRQEVAE
tara:strand:- start:1215 stop:1598 length:384 start_codon:yes stop_codon:yes gene_type:complete